jgi:hypothetical protein
MQHVEFLCLANSRKLGGRCIAGVTASGSWIRPVSADQDGVLSWSHYRLDGDAEPAVLDVIRLEATPAPEPDQPENWVISTNRWQRIGRLASHDARARLHQLASSGPLLLGSPSNSIEHAYLVGHRGRPSLCAVEPSELWWRIRATERGKQVRAVFSLGGAQYDLPVTDPVIEQRLGDLLVGNYGKDVGGISADDAVFLVISLSKPLGGLCYKLIAAVIAL